MSGSPGRDSPRPVEQVSFTVPGDVHELCDVAIWSDLEEVVAVEARHIDVVGVVRLDSGRVKESIPFAVPGRGVGGAASYPRLSLTMSPR